MRNRGSNIRRKGGKKQGVKGGATPPLQNMAITSLWYRCILLQPLRIEKDSRAASIDFTGEKDYRIANMPLPERNNEQAANTYLQWEKE